MDDIKIGKVTIGLNKPVVVIAEVACEHRGSLDSAKRLIKAAHEAGADMVKFQLHVPDKEMIPGVIKFWAGSMDEILKEVNFERAEEHQELKKYCEQIGTQYLCTPFCIAAVDVLDKVGVPGYKTGSGELSNLPMLRYIARKGKPVIVSTGMSTLEEIDDAVAVLKEEYVQFALTHCLSEYPAKYENLNLGLIPVLRDRYGVIVGYSDHTNDIYAPLAAVAMGAKIIEKHFTIRDLHGPDDLVSLDPEQFKTMVQAIRNIEKSLGNKKQVHEGEREVRDWAHHSVATTRPIAKGEILTAEVLMPKRPGRGIPAKFLDSRYSSALLGKRAKRDIQKNILLRWEDLS